jgi:hypothetical protein
MSTRSLRIVKRTPIAIGICDCCNFQFHSSEPNEDNAELEMRRQFIDHECRRLDDPQEHAKAG